MDYRGDDEYEYKKLNSMDYEFDELVCCIDGNKFTQQDFQYIQQLPEILADSGEPAFHGEVGNLIVEIFDEMNTYENNLIICKK